MTMKEIKFPIANVSIKNWDKNEDYLLYVLDSPYIFTPKETFYGKYLSNHSFVDSNGNVFKITGRIFTNRVRKILRFIPGFYKAELVFEQTGETMDREEIRNHIVRQLEKLDDYEHKAEWIRTVKNATTIEGIISGDN
jgi:hypothetical protein